MCPVPHTFFDVCGCLCRAFGSGRLSQGAVGGLVNFSVAFAAFFRYLSTKVQNLCAFVCDVGLNLLLSKCFNAYKGQCKRLVACTNAYGLN